MSDGGQEGGDDGDRNKENGGSISAAERGALLRKYRLLARWRNRKDGDETEQADRGAMRAMAREFPGALRELDVLGLPEIRRRITSLADPACQEPWMEWIAAYHGLMRAALAIKRTSGRTREVPATTFSDLLARVGLSSGMSVDESFVRDAVQPPGGRLGIVVLSALAAHFQVSATAISRTLFPPRRPGPYRLSS